VTLPFADLSLETSVKYVAAAYAVSLIVLVLYVWLLRSKLSRLESGLADAERELARRPLPPGPEPERAAPRETTGVEH
jgi:hypothetical protein